MAALAALVGVVWAARRYVRTRRALEAERAARRLAAGMHARDREAFAARLNAVLGARAVLAEADRIVDSALAAYDPEGGSK
ncbi:hypothetical protein [Streptomyces sp. NPDC001658]